MFASISKNKKSTQIKKKKQNENVKRFYSEKLGSKAFMHNIMTCDTNNIYVIIQV